MHSLLLNTFARQRRLLGDGVFGPERTRQNLAVLDYYESGQGDGEIDVDRHLPDARADWIKGLILVFVPVMLSIPVAGFFVPGPVNLGAFVPVTLLLATLMLGFHVWHHGLFPTRKRLLTRLRLEAAIGEIITVLATGKSKIREPNLDAEARSDQ